MQAKLLFLHALSPLHAGTGQGVGVIDLPIAREKATDIPIVPGSSLKGVLRDGCSDDDLRTRVFGPDTNNAELHAGSVQFTDLRLLLLPVRSLVGVFAWVTSPLLLHRFSRDAAGAKDAAPPTAIPSIEQKDICLIASEGHQITRSAGDGQDKAIQVVLEDLDLTAQPSSDVSAWADWLGKYLFPTSPEWRATLKGRLCVVPDDVLGFLLNTATEITARIGMDDNTKTVQDGALWYEEALPTETILSGLVLATNVKSKPDEVFATVADLSKEMLQVGGNATVGRGLCQVRLV